MPGKDILSASPTSIDAQTLRAYRETDYRVGTGEPITLHIDEYCAPLATLHAACGVSCSAFITACNPQSGVLDSAENAARQAELAQTVTALGLTCLAGVGIHPAGDWPGEESFLIPGLELARARHLGERFRQNAVVWMDKDCIPRLILLR